MWSLDYVQVPVEDEQKPKESDSETDKISNEHAKTGPPHHRLVKQIHVSQDGSRNLMKSGSESSLSGEPVPKSSIVSFIFY